MTSQRLHYPGNPKGLRSDSIKHRKTKTSKKKILHAFCPCYRSAMATRQDNSSWIVGSFRATGIFSPPSAPELDLIFKACAQAEPSSEHVNRREGSRVLSGQFHGGKLDVTLAVNRVDVSISPDIESQTFDPMNFPAIGDLWAARQGFSQIFAALTENFFDYTRLAVGGTFLLPEASPQASYSRLTNLLPSVCIDAENSRDLFYRINRPRMATIEGNSFPCNRVASWSAVQMQTHFSDPTGAEISPSTSKFAVHLETDVNTLAAVDLRGLSKAQKFMIFERLEAFCVELIEKGDVK